MKKHPLIRPLHYDKLSSLEEIYPRSVHEVDKDISNSELRRVGRNNIIVLETESNMFVPSFVFDNSGTSVSIPVPDMSLVYLRLAYTNFKDAIDAKLALFKKKEQTINTSLEDSYRYIGAATIGVVNLYNSIESFCNQIIPQGIKIPKKDKMGLKELGYKEVIKLSIAEKVKFVLPDCCGKSFIHVNQGAYNYLLDKINVRNQIVHLTYEGKIDDQVDLFQKLLIMDYQRLYDAAVKFFNFYRSDYVMECDCTNNF